MSPKQSIYQEILGRALPTTRNTLSQFKHGLPIKVIGPRSKNTLSNAYEIAELIHNLHICLWEEDLVNHDIWFLNVHARSFCEKNDLRSNPLYGQIAYYIQELFKLVPKNRKHELEWEGPQGDFSKYVPTAENY